jgi:hypothetical protein
VAAVGRSIVALDSRNAREPARSEAPEIGTATKSDTMKPSGRRRSAGFSLHGAPGGVSVTPEWCGRRIYPEPFVFPHRLARRGLSSQDDSAKPVAS